MLQVLKCSIGLIRLIFIYKCTTIKKVAHCLLFYTKSQVHMQMWDFHFWFCFVLFLFSLGRLGEEFWVYYFSSKLKDFTTSLVSLFPKLGNSRAACWLFPERCYHNLTLLDELSLYTIWGMTSLESYSILYQSCEWCLKGLEKHPFKDGEKLH